MNSFAQRSGGSAGYTTGSRNFIPEFGRYAFPAISALAVLVAASLNAFPRRWVPLAGACLLIGMIGLIGSRPRGTVTTTVVPSSFGVKPYSAMLGALRVRDAVEVRAEVRLP